MCHRLDRPRWAYSLLELMIVLAILTAMAGLSWPALMRPWSKNLVQQAGQELARELNRTRGLAIERSCVFYLRWRPGGTAYQVARARNASGTGQTHDNPLDPNASLGELDRGGASAMPNAEMLGTEKLTAERAGSLPGGLGSDAAAEFQLPEGVRFRAAAADARGLLPAGAEPAADGFGNADEAASGRVSERDTTGGDASTAGESADTLESLLSDGQAWSESIAFYPDGRATNASWTLESREGYELDVTLRGLTGMATVGPVRATQTVDDAANDMGQEEPSAEATEQPANMRNPDAAGTGVSP